MTDAAPTAQEQCRIIANLVTGQPLGTYGYVVATEWCNKWQKYVGSQRMSFPHAGRPGSLTMDDSGYGNPFASQYTHPIATMSDCVNTLVDEKIWSKWVEWYGVDDSHHLNRHGYAWPPHRNSLGTYHVCLLNSYSKHVKYPTKVFDKREECGYIEFQLRRMFDIPAGRKTKLWLRKGEVQQAGYHMRAGQQAGSLPRFQMVFNRSSTISSVQPEDAGTIPMYTNDVSLCVWQIFTYIVPYV